MLVNREPMCTYLSNLYYTSSAVSGPKDINALEAKPGDLVNNGHITPVVEQVRDYRITEEIGSGGMAVVYKGIQESLGRVVAVKALKTSVSADANVVARFKREALSVASFQHENLITLYDFFHEHGALFMVMEYVEGIDLYDLLERCAQLPHDVVAIVALQVAHALDYAHFRGIIHRDVKPANIIISKFGEVKLTDFGIARIQQSDLTETGIGLGTPAYMSPEQIVGDPLDHRTDIWSLGVVCYQMLAGRKPFLDDQERSALQRIRMDEPVPLRKINAACPKELDFILRKCLRKSAQERYGSAQELVIALEQYLAAHVHTNYRARTVMFLREQGVISDDETSAMLHPALIGEYSMRVGLPAGRRHRGRRTRPKTLLRSALAIIASVAIGALGATYFAKRATDALNGTRSQTQAKPALAPKPDGFLRILAHPWARVEVDGQAVAITPRNEPLRLSPGKHTVLLTNPYFEQEVREVTIKPDEVVTLTVALKRRPMEITQPKAENAP